MRSHRHSAAAPARSDSAPLRSSLESGHLSFEPDHIGSSVFLAAILLLAALWLLFPSAQPSPMGFETPQRQATQLPAGTVGH